jgi:cytosine/adenosine deaminase-related metal-dependent hydrolase
MIELGCREQVPLAMHLAETREEVEWLAGSANGFSLLQERLGVPNQQQWRPALDWLIEQLALAPRALVVHGNYLSRQHWQQLARNRQRLSVVYCPRTHHYFGHPRYPLVEMLAEGVRVAIGTDSRASNPNLDVLEELRLIRRLFPELKPAEILRLATVNGAEALGQAERLGQLAVGMSPSLLSVQCPPGREVDPAAWLLDSDAKVEPLHPLPLN